MSSQSIYPRSDVGCEIKWEWPYVPCGLSTNSREGDQKFVRKVQHEWVDPEREEVVPALYAEDSVYDIL